MPHGWASLSTQLLHSFTVAVAYASFAVTLHARLHGLEGCPHLSAFLQTQPHALQSSLSVLDIHYFCAWCSRTEVVQGFVVGVDEDEDGPYYARLNPISGASWLRRAFALLSGVMFL